MAEVGTVILLGIVGAGIVGFGGVKLFNKINESFERKKFQMIVDGKRQNILQPTPLNPNSTLITTLGYKDENDEIQKILLSDIHQPSGQPVTQPSNIQMPEQKHLSYKEDFKNFQKANKEMEKLKKKYEKGKLSYPELKERFEYFQNQDYYQRVREGKY